MIMLESIVCTGTLRRVLIIFIVDARSLEFAHYKTRLGQLLQQKGFSVGGSAPEYQAVIGYSLAQANNDEDWGGAVLLSPSYVKPSPYANAVVVQSTNSKRRFRRELTLIVRHRHTEERVYEARAVSVGACDVFAVVFDEMAQAILKTYPAANGSIQTLAVPGDLICR